MLDAPAQFGATIAGFVQGDVIDLRGIGTASSATLGANNVLTVQEEGGGSILLNLAPSQDYAGLAFNVTPDGAGGSDVLVAPTLSIGAIDGDNIVNAAAAAAGVAISGTAIGADGQTVTVALQQAFDISADFSIAANPNRVWTYGYATSLGGPLVNYDRSGTEFGTQPIQFWRSAEISNGDVPAFGVSLSGGVPFCAGRA